MESNNNPAPSEAPTPEANVQEVPSFPTQPAEPIQPTSQSDPKPTKSSKPVIWCLAILATIGIVAAIIFAYLYFTTPTNPSPAPTNPSTSTTEPTTEPTDEEVEITDTYILKDLNEKIAILHDTTQTDSTIDKGTVVGGYSEPIFTMYKTGYINPYQYRVAYVINNLKPQFNYLSTEEREAIAEEVDPQFREEVKNTAMQGIDGEIVAKRFKEVFGEELRKETADSCYAYSYNSTYDVYYYMSACGGTSPYKTFHYKNKYTANKEHAYVYVSVALTSGENGNVYCDISYLDISGVFKLSENAKVCDTFAMDTDFTLGESNYQDYAQYRFVFNKADDGTYYFSKVEKITD